MNSKGFPSGHILRPLKVKAAMQTGGRGPDLAEARTENAEAPPISAEFMEGKVVVTDSSRFGELEESGYGVREGKSLTLKEYEALYLLYSKKLDLRGKAGEPVGFEGLAQEIQLGKRDAWTKFIIYRDLRSRGYVVKEGFGFGTDLRVYERGDFPKKAAKYVVFALDEGIERRVDDLQQSVRRWRRWERRQSSR
jgi:tRNA-intron endonuclease